MGKLLDQIHDYYCSLYPHIEREKVISDMDGSSVNIALEIAEYAHRDQKQINGREYIWHPVECLHLYRVFVRMNPFDFFSIDCDDLEKAGIPFHGVQEVCVLHDVLEDTAITIDDIESIYDELGLLRYFDLYIKQSLLLITHDKTKDYDSYMNEVLKNPISAIVKMMDLTDNMNLLRLNRLDNKNIERFKKYFKYFIDIENKYAFIQKNYMYQNQ